MIFVIDIDNTILYSERLKNGKYKIKGENKKLILKIRKLFNDGHEIILYTARHWKLLKDTKKTLDLFLIPYTTLVMGKPVGDFYVDDKGMTPEIFLKEVKNYE
jgi:hydroxymethylpyrimidine pyrophosphatase-like HAD family hydrolase